MALLSICGCVKWSVQRTLAKRQPNEFRYLQGSTSEQVNGLVPGLRQPRLNISTSNPAKCHCNWEQSADITVLHKICSSAEHRDGTCRFSLRRPDPHVLSFSLLAEGPLTLNSYWLISSRLFSKDVLFHDKASAWPRSFQRSVSFCKNSNPFGLSARTPLGDGETRATCGTATSQDSSLQKKWMPTF